MLELTVASAIFGLIGVVVAIGSYIKFRRVRRPLFYTVGQTVVDDMALSDLEIRYRGRNVPRVSKAVVVFWNGGTTAIREDDIAPADPLRIEVPDGAEILTAAVACRTREANCSDIDIADSSTTLPLKFDFLDPNDGLTVALVHTGDAPKETTTVKGTVMEAPNDGVPERVLGAVPSHRTKRVAIQVAAISLIGVGLGAGYLMWRFSLPPLTAIPIFVVIVGLVAVYAVLSAAPKGKGRRRPYVMPSELLPDE